MVGKISSYLAYPRAKSIIFQREPHLDMHMCNFKDNKGADCMPKPLKEAS